MRGASSGTDQRMSLSESDIVRVVQDGYGLTVIDQRRLGGEVDHNVWIRTDGGQEFLFKASLGPVDDSLLWQESVLSHLARAAPQLPVPRLIDARSGATMRTVDIDAMPVVIRLLTWMPGKMHFVVMHRSDELLSDEVAVDIAVLSEGAGPAAVERLVLRARDLAVTLGRPLEADEISAAPLP